MVDNGYTSYYIHSPEKLDLFIVPLLLFVEEDPPLLLQ